MVRCVVSCVVSNFRPVHDVFEPIFWTGLKLDKFGPTGPVHMIRAVFSIDPRAPGNRQFQAKTPKSIRRNISGTINPTNTRFEDRIQTTIGTSWVVCYYLKANTTWLTAAILKIDLTS